MAKPILIGITGKARSGKDTVGAYLQTKYGVERYAFAWPLKAGLRTMLGLDGRHTDGELKEIPLEEFGGKSPREMLQTLGTEWGRNHVSGSLWVDLGLAFADRMRAEGKSVVITDVRFENEAVAIRQAGGVVVHIARDDAQTVAAHSSEAGVAMAPGDIAITNNGSLELLFGEVDWIAGELGLEPRSNLGQCRPSSAGGIA